MINLRQERFLTGDALAASGFDDATLQNVLKRGRITWPNLGSGGRRVYTGEKVLQLAFARQLMRFHLGPNQATYLVRFTTKYFDVDRLREYLSGPTGLELFIMWPALEPDDEKVTGMSWEFIENGVIDFEKVKRSIDPCEPFIVLPVGLIAKEVIAKLESILAEREST